MQPSPVVLDQENEPESLHPRDERVAEACLRLIVSVTSCVSGHRRRLKNESSSLITPGDHGASLRLAALNRRWSGGLQPISCSFLGVGADGWGSQRPAALCPFKEQKRSTPPSRRGELKSLLFVVGGNSFPRRSEGIRNGTSALMLAIMLTWITHHTFFSFAVSSLIPLAKVFVCTN